MKENVKTVIMAGGQGTRISELFPDLPKPLIPIRSAEGQEKPVLEWEIESLRDQGYTDIILTVSYMAEKIQDYFGDGNRLGVHISYYIEETPLGNAGALFKIRDQLGDEDFFLLNADAMFDVDLRRMLEWHRRTGALVTLFSHPNSHPFDSGILIADQDDSVDAWLTKEDPKPKWYKNRVNAGLHVINPSALDIAAETIDTEMIGKPGTDGKTVKIDLDRQVLKPLCGTRRMYCYDSPEYVKDMGTPERYVQVCRDFQNGLVEAKNLRLPQKAIFMDRDGTINQYAGFLRNIEDFTLTDRAADAIRTINESGYLAIVITNQPVIARGEVTHDELRMIHNKMETLLCREGAYIDALFFCPHHPHSGFAGEVKELKIDCNCRKPKPGMLLQAAERFNIDLSASWMVGDDDVDVMAGKNAGCHTVLISSNGENKCDADRVTGSLLAAVEEILDQKAGNKNSYGTENTKIY